MSTWKSTTLAMAGRVTLVQSSSSTMPSYTMQTMDLPSSVCDRIDKINKNFLWGDTAVKRKLHLINWHTVCKHKDNGGLGIRKAKSQNLALLTKLGWKLTVKEDSLWVTFLHDKYLNNHTMATWPHNRAASHVWRSIIKTQPTLDKGIKWTIGDGTLVDIWKEWWCSTGPLCNRFPGPHTNDNRTVADLIDGNGIWNLTSISHIVDEDVLNSILNIHIPRFSNVQDHPYWMGSANGNFLLLQLMI